MTKTKRVKLIGGPLDGQERVINADRREVDLANPTKPVDSTLSEIEHSYSTYQQRKNTPQDTMYFVE